MRSRISTRGYVRPSVGPSVTHELKPCKKAVFDQKYFQYERERILCRVSGLVMILPRMRAVHVSLKNPIGSNQCQRFYVKKYSLNFFAKRKV